MPIYEYRCLACKRRTSVFVRSVSSPVNAACEHCGSKRLTRMMSRFAVHGSGGAVDFDDPARLEGIDDDPRAMARWARQMREETGEDLGPDFDDMVERMERGEMPEEFGDEDAFGDDGLDDEF